MKYPIGIQNFKELREGGFAYVDKPNMYTSLPTKANTTF